MVKYLNEAFDDSYTGSILSKAFKLNRELADDLTKNGIDIKQLWLNEYNGRISNINMYMSAKNGLENGEILGFLFPSGYLYVVGCRNYGRMAEVDSPGPRHYYYNDLFKYELLEKATPVILSNIVPIKKRDVYRDPRYTYDYAPYNGKVANYAGQLRPRSKKVRKGWLKAYDQIGGIDSDVSYRDKSGYEVMRQPYFKRDLMRKRGRTEW